MNIDVTRALFVIDGSSFLYRAYYGLKPLYTKNGEPVQAVYSFCRMIQKLITTMHVSQIVVAWDSKGETSRHRMYPAYKATRQEAPSDIFQQKERIITFLECIGIAQISVTGVEADDIMYSLAHDRAKTDEYTVLVTTDKDMGQALNTHTFMYDAFKEILYDTQSFEQKMSVPTNRLALYFALLGDSSDNIPGVKGIGKKGAQEIATHYASLDELYANIEKISSKRTYTALTEQKENAYLSYNLFLLSYTKLSYQPNDFLFNASYWEKAIPFFLELDFKSLIPESTKTSTAKSKSLDEKINYYKEKYSFILVTTLEQLSYVCSQIEKHKIFALDTEGNSLRPLQSVLAGLSLCVKEGEAFYIPCGHRNGEEQLSLDIIQSKLGPYLSDPSYGKILHNAKFDYLMLTAQNMPLNGIIFDTMIAASLIVKEWQRVGLKDLSAHYLNEEMISFKEAVSEQGHASFLTVPFHHALYYAANDAHQTLRLWPIMQQELNLNDVENLYKTIELPTMRVLCAMEQEGIICDAQKLSTLGKKIDTQLRDVDAQIRTLINDPLGAFNFNSPKQMRTLLFEHLGLPPQKKSSGGKDLSTDKEVLQELAHHHPVPGLILQYRELFKLKSTYIEALPAYIDQKTQKIHTTYNQVLVATGRLSSAEPNLQNIPADAQGFGIEIREAFKPLPGHLLISADYSQIELRVLAHLSGDIHLQKAFLENRDIHQETAARLFECAIEEVTHEQRQLGKRINFSILYGLTPYGLSKDLRIPFNDAKKYIEKYFAQYPGVSAWMAQIIEQGKKLGYASTYFGRRRFIPALQEQNKTLYQEACRIAINTVAQGTAAELIKLGMIKVHHMIKHEYQDARLLLQIHDELLISVPHATVETFSIHLEKALESVVNWSIPLHVTVRAGTNWKIITK